MTETTNKTEFNAIVRNVEKLLKKLLRRTDVDVTIKIKGVDVTVYKPAGKGTNSWKLKLRRQT
jgi:hypothetical protein